ncbi:hypothetical protein [Aeromonas dhakensis]|uniref:hypothetical protein n=1 Tax=Aeromonas dhakensis TaxID=196024 RepID=UPI00191E2CEE|nr:hypothetical protein [Aeromonas dhakensis]MBL0602530.1 hypothetical protein [Aeromonas dhakensis]MBL0618982.1 hypothetical protein [Aeromonas dhakensis]
MSPRIFLLGSLLLSGCALLPAPATVTELASANPALQRFQIECAALEECQQQATLSCPLGYQETERRQRTFTSHQMSMGAADPMTGFRPSFPQISTFTTHTLLVQCPRKPAQPHPLGR